MDKNNITQNTFAMIADVEGDIRDLINRRVERVLPVLPLRNMVLFPGVIAPISIGRESSVELIRKAVEQGEDGYIAIACQIEPQVDTPEIFDIHPVGVLAKVVRLIEFPGQPMTAIVQAYGRIALSSEPASSRPYLSTAVTHLPDELPEEDSEEFQALFDVLRDTTIKYVKRSDQLGPEALFAVQNISNQIFFVNFVATNLPLDTEERAHMLRDDSLLSRSYNLLRYLQRELKFLNLKAKIKAKTNEELEQQQKEYYLQQQLRNIQSELGNDENGDIIQLRARVEEVNLSPEARTLFDRELHKMERINPTSPDYHVTLNYLETILTLPWGKQTPDKVDLPKATRILNGDHYGMENVKERILEHLAMMKVRQSGRASILCLYGPPGVGKTSLCQSIAKSLGKEYVRMSLGGVHDESEIRGHRRTYVGAMCGRVMKNLIKAKTDNPVFVLDEIDKVGGGSYNGDPQSALLELLDPEQNSTFHDNYLDFGYDLSKVFFIATANYVGNIPAPLRDRMELIEVEGYLTEEKKEIARRHLLPKETAELDLPFQLKLAPSAIEFIIEKYTRESGVRQLSKQIAKLVRKVVLRTQTSDAATVQATYGKALKPADVHELLGTVPYNRDSYQGNAHAGVVTGLAWTSVGGEILFIESTLSRSKAPRLSITGNLGTVMKESTMLAFEYVRIHAEELGVDPRIFDHWSVHIHFPEGATPKDGPSAGITIATALASAITQRKVRPHIAMTGEITLRGKVLPVGGIKEKILAAKRAGITDILLSKHNEKDILDIPNRYVKGLHFHFVDTVSEVWDFSLLDQKVAHARTFDIPAEPAPAPVVTA